MSVNQDTILIASVRQFEDEIYMLSSQTESRLMQYVRQKPIVGSHQYIDRLGTVNPVLKTQSVQPTVFGNIDHSRRQITLRDYVQALPLDEQDQLRLIHDFTGDYARRLSQGMGRQIDTDIIVALEGTSFAVDVNLGFTPVPLPASQIVPIDFDIPATPENMTIGKIKQAKFLMDTAEVPKENRYIAWNSSAEQALLNDVKVTSSDFSTMKTLMNGEIDTWLGFKFERLELLTGTNTSVANMIAFQTNGIGMADAQQLTVRIDERADLNYTRQVHVASTFGVTRVEEVTVVLILCKQD